MEKGLALPNVSAGQGRGHRRRGGRHFGKRRLDDCPKGHAALSRSTSFMPPARPEVTDFEPRGGAPPPVFYTAERGKITLTGIILSHSVSAKDRSNSVRSTASTGTNPVLPPSREYSLSQPFSGISALSSLSIQPWCFAFFSEDASTAVNQNVSSALSQTTTK